MFWDCYHCRLSHLWPFNWIVASNIHGCIVHSVIIYINSYQIIQNHCLGCARSFFWYALSSDWEQPLRTGKCESSAVEWASAPLATKYGQAAHNAKLSTSLSSSFCQWMLWWYWIREGGPGSEGPGLLPPHLQKPKQAVSFVYKSDFFSLLLHISEI